MPQDANVKLTTSAELPQNCLIAGFRSVTDQTCDLGLIISLVCPQILISQVRKTGYAGSGLG